MKCEEASHVCDKNQYREANFLEKIRLNIHLLYCNACRKYAARNRKLTQMIKDSNLKSMPQKDKDIINNKLRQEMSK